MKFTVSALLLLAPITAYALQTETIQLNNELISDKYKVVLSQKLERTNFYKNSQGDLERHFFERAEKHIFGTIYSSYYDYFSSVNEPCSIDEYQDNLIHGSSISRYARHLMCVAEKSNNITVSDDEIKSGKFVFYVGHPSSNYDLWVASREVILIAEPSEIEKQLVEFERKFEELETKVMWSNVGLVSKWVLAVLVTVASVLLTFMFVRNMFRTVKKVLPDLIGFTKYKQKQAKDKAEINRIKKIAETEIIKQVARNEVNQSSGDEIAEMRQLIAKAINNGDSQTAQSLSKVLEKMLDR